MISKSAGERPSYPSCQSGDAGKLCHKHERVGSALYIPVKYWPKRTQYISVLMSINIAKQGTHLSLSWHVSRKDSHLQTNAPRTYDFPRGSIPQPQTKSSEMGHSRLCSLLQRQQSRGLPPQPYTFFRQGCKFHRDLSDQSGKRQFPQQQICRFLILANLTQSFSSWFVPMWSFDGLIGSRYDYGVSSCGRIARFSQSCSF